MAQSRRYQILKKRLAQLRHRLLPRVFSPTGDYSATQLDRARAYRLLVHAEIEAFMEDRATELATKAFQSWRTDLKPRHTITALLGFCRASDKSYPTLLECVGAAFATFNFVVRSNHSIKEDDILKFLLAVGVQRSQLDETWLSTMSSFGTARGEVAHCSIRVHQPIDPRTELNIVSNILLGLGQLDEIMSSIS